MSNINAMFKQQEHLMKAVLAILPHAIFDVDKDGELIVMTGYIPRKNGSLRLSKYID
jgi:hypothetical protein